MYAPGRKPVPEPKAGWLHRIRRRFYPVQLWNRYLHKLLEQETRYQKFVATLPTLQDRPSYTQEELEKSIDRILGKVRSDGLLTVRPIKKRPRYGTDSAGPR